MKTVVIVMLGPDDIRVRATIDPAWSCSPSASTRPWRAPGRGTLNAPAPRVRYSGIVRERSALPRKFV